MIDPPVVIEPVLCRETYRAREGGKPYCDIKACSACHGEGWHWSDGVPPRLCPELDRACGRTCETQCARGCTWVQELTLVVPRTKQVLVRGPRGRFVSLATSVPDPVGCTSAS